MMRIKVRTRGKIIKHDVIRSEVLDGLLILYIELSTGMCTLEYPLNSIDYVSGAPL